jgi:hypothetical protein
MNDERVSVFLYGSWIDRDVLAEVELAPERFDVARLPGWDIRIRPEARIRGRISRAARGPSALKARERAIAVSPPDSNPAKAERIPPGLQESA